jgi:hypothetical protein
VTALHQRLAIDVPETDYPHLTGIAQEVANLDARLKDAP